MKIVSVTISNHSRLSDCTIDVRDNLILVGPNGSGKSSLIRCLDLLLGRSQQQLYHTISEKDFKDKELPFTVEAKLIGLDLDEMSFFPDEIDTSDNSLTIRLEATLDEDDLTVERFCPKGIVGRSLSTTQLRCIRWNAIPSDYSTQSLRAGKNTIIDRLLKEIDTTHSQADLSNAINALCKVIDGSDSFSNAIAALVAQLNPALNGGIKAERLRFVPGASIDGNLLSDIRLQITDELGVVREATEQSDGTKALIAFAVFNVLNPGGIIAIDEPETHLHPTARRNLIHVLKQQNRQLIIATHSGIIAGEFNPESITVTHSGLTPTQTELGYFESEKDKKTLARWWISSKLELLTAKHIIAVEGQTDRMMVERVAELTGCHLERDGIEILEAGSGDEMPHVLKIFGKDGFNIRVSILIDQDAETGIAKELGIDKQELPANSVFVSNRDLEDEYVSAIGSNTLWNALNKSSLFTPNMLKNCNVTNGAVGPNESELAEFCRQKNYKTKCALIAQQLLDKDSATRVTSVTEVLRDAIR